MKVKEIQKSHFNLGYRAIIANFPTEGRETPTQWFGSYNSLRATLKSSGMDVPKAGDLKWSSNGFDASYAFIL